MSNRVKLWVEFSFKGRTLCPSIEINLDEFMAKSSQLPALHPLLAQRNNLDSYSYEYEMLLAEDIQCQALEGWVGDYINDKQLDINGFEQQWQAEKELDLLNAIATKHLDITDLNQSPKLKAAMLAAYELGRSINN